MINYEEYECMCWEKDEFGQTLCCRPSECEIQFCPVKRLIESVRVLNMQVESLLSQRNGFATEIAEMESKVEAYDEWKFHVKDKALKTMDLLILLRRMDAAKRVLEKYLGKDLWLDDITTTDLYEEFRKALEE
jgi:hypothetical protein